MAGRSAASAGRINMASSCRTVAVTRSRRAPTDCEDGAMPEPIAPDTKDWTWVLEQPCAECGFEPTAQTLTEVPRLIHDTAMVWSDVLRRPDVREQPAPGIWSPLEYACHIRDVHRIFAERVELMLAEDEPRFANWDQDETA